MDKSLEEKEEGDKVILRRSATSNDGLPEIGHARNS
jgi:hypothetical protein